MNSRTLVALVFAAFALWAFLPAISRFPQLGYVGAGFDSNGGCTWPVKSVSPDLGSPLRVGDRFVFPVERDGRRIDVPVVAVPLPAG